MPRSAALPYRTRPPMAVAPRARPEDFFAPAQWTALTARSPWRGPWLGGPAPGGVAPWGAAGGGRAVFTAAGFWWVWLTLWLLPMVCWLPMVFRIRNIAEHALVGVNQADPLRQARTTLAGWVERALLAPYWVNFHNEHHLFTQLPCWQLPRAHALLRAAGTTRRMEVQPGYLSVLRLATAGWGAPRPAGSGPLGK